ncbi:sulfatase family protein [Rossellomorea vietnamensis]|uniref:sulfatase family protein n=1 Tax=Rossellomorea vietnamensis TaxID=218284 RepID=UPI001E5E8844|nr:sulfatase [Rossellomorea vietnamensis]MCC5800782.1 sulfatase [Rossellomorea vietnamensis]
MNIVYIHTHDTGKYIKPYGRQVPTPNLLSFAKEALLFTNAFNGSPTCSPSRASFMTGTYPHQNGMLGLAHRGFQLVDFDWHLASYLKSMDFETVLCGVQHEHRFWKPLKQGEEAAKELGYTTHLTSDMEGYQVSSSLTEWDKENAQRVVEYVRKRERQDKPFFLSYGLYTTHREYPSLTEEEKEGDFNPNYIEVPAGTFQDEKSRLDTAQFHKSAQIADDCFGQVIDVLKEQDLYDETLILFSTDHGVANPFMKGSLTDAGIGVPLIIRHPDRPDSYSRVSDQLVSHLDVFPTICDCLDLEKPDHLEGKSFIEVFQNVHKKTREAVFAETNFHTSYEPARCIRTERYKYIKYVDESFQKYNLSNCDESYPKEMLMENGWAEKTKGQEYLYDLYFDPLEGNNLVHDVQYQEIVCSMREELRQWQIKTSDPLLQGKLDYSPSWKVNKKSSFHPSSKEPEDYEQVPEPSSTSDRNRQG